MTKEKLVVEPLPDKEHRDLASGLDESKAALNTNVFIEAGAGTGKTETIVRRIINQLYSNESLSMANVAAITFTEKAAAELRNRFRKMLNKDLNDKEHQHKDLTHKLILELDSAFIGTIHAFARNILTQHAVAANIPVGFRIANEVSSESLRTERARKVVGLALKSLTNQERKSFFEIEFGSKQMLEMVTLMDQKFTRLVTGYKIDSVNNTESYQLAAIKFMDKAFEVLSDELESRRQAGGIEFDDLLILTQRLLKQDRKVREIIHNQFTVLVIDEFQDTDPVQWDIAKLITSNPNDDVGIPMPGRLTVVGDPKQAIYAFRGGDINTYISAKNEFPSFGSILQLSANFRTVNPVLKFINNAFVDYEAPNINPLKMGVSYEPLINIHDPEHSNPGDPVILIKNDDAVYQQGFKSTEFDWTGYEFKQTALAIRKAIDENWLVTGLGKEFGYQRVYTREANYSDVCVLVPVRTHLKELLKEFEAQNIPYRSTDPAIVYDRPLIAGIRDAISVISKSDDMTKLWGALKSPLFGFTDKELFEHRQLDGKWYVQAKPEGGLESINFALSLLYGLAENLASSSPVWVIRELTSRLDLFSTLRKDSLGDFEASCLRMVLAHAQQWLSDGNVGLLNYLNWVNTMLSESTRAQLPESDELDSNSVNIMTIHASKGLEFPITVVTALASTLKADRPKLLFKQGAPGTNLGLEFCLTSKDKNSYYESAGFSQQLRGEYLASVIEEINRLIYVAATRAQDHLIISAVAAPRSKDEIKKGVPSSTPPRGRRFMMASENFPVGTYEYLENYIPLEVGKAGKPQSRKVSDSDKSLIELAKNLSAEKVMRAPSSKEGEPKPEVNRRKSGKDSNTIDGRPKGRAVHKIMELVMLGNGIPDQATLDKYIEDQVLLEQAEEHSDDIKLIVHKILENREILEALSTELRWPELHLALQVDETPVRFIEGFADLVYKAKDGYVLVDYKTDSDLEVSKAHYAEQLGAYAAVIEAVTSEPIARILIIHARTDQAETVPID